MPRGSSFSGECKFEILHSAAKNAKMYNTILFVCLPIKDPLLKPLGAIYCGGIQGELQGALIGLSHDAEKRQSLGRFIVGKVSQKKISQKKREAMFTETAEAKYSNLERKKPYPRETSISRHNGGPYRPQIYQSISYSDA